MSKFDEWQATLVAANLLKGHQSAIVLALVRCGPSTSGEILNEFHCRNINAMRGRFTELSARGLIREVGQRRCKVSGRICVVWAPTGRDKPLNPAKGDGRGRTPKQARSVREGWRHIADRLANQLSLALRTGAGDPAGRDTKALADYRRMAGP
jgi:hypothetical protein